jgi:catechol 2,3-dioxygenase-like lactoylglutathione lyase family enzyme
MTNTLPATHSPDEPKPRFSDRAIPGPPIIVTDLLAACRDFYVRRLGFTVGFESSWIIYLTADDGSASVAFMAPDHPSAPPGPEPYAGRGICFELQVEDATAALETLTANGLEVGYPLTDEPFGQRRLGFHDPAGVWIDVVEQIDPAPGFWDRYPPGTGAER